MTDHMFIPLLMLYNNCNAVKMALPVADLGGGGFRGSIEPPFLGNSKFLQFIPPKKFHEPVLHLPLI